MGVASFLLQPTVVHADTIFVHQNGDSEVAIQNIFLPHSVFLTMRLVFYFRTLLFQTEYFSLVIDFKKIHTIQNGKRSP